MFRVYFAGNKKVNMDYNGFTIETDQSPRAGGDGTAPAPYDLFLASIGTCAGIYVKGFCDSRGISAEGIELYQTLDFDPIRGKISKINIEIHVPDNFPEKYRDALVQVANNCAVKKTIYDPPAFEVRTVVDENV